MWFIYNRHTQHSIRAIWSGSSFWNSYKSNESVSVSERVKFPPTAITRSLLSHSQVKNEERKERFCWSKRNKQRLSGTRKNSPLLHPTLLPLQMRYLPVFHIKFILCQRYGATGKPFQGKSANGEPLASINGEKRKQVTMKFNLFLTLSTLKMARKWTIAVVRFTLQLHVKTTS